MRSSDPSGRPALAPLPWAAVVAVAVLVLMAAQLAAFTDRYAVDVMYWDGWDLHRTLFDGQGWWATFDQQHGPHRQGVGGWVLRAAALATRWDSRADAWAVWGSLVVAAALGLRLAWRCGARGWPLVAVPAAYLNPRQFQMLVAAANPSHGAMPLALLSGWGLACFALRPAVRAGWLAGLTAVAIFTGFGLFLGVVTPAMLAVEWVRRRDRRANGSGLSAVAVVWLAFAYNYRWPTATQGGNLAVEHPGDYARFVGVMVANAVGVTGIGSPTIAVGLTVAVAAAAVGVLAFVRLARSGLAGDPTSAVVTGMAAFGLMFAAYAAAGRTHFGWQLGASSRYVTLCVPLVVTLLIAVARQATTPPRRRLVTVAAATLVAGTLVLRPADLAVADWARDGCLRWRSAYLSTGNVASADRAARFPIYERPGVDPRVRYLRDHQLNLFDPSAYGGR